MKKSRITHNTRLGYYYKYIKNCEYFSFLGTWALMFEAGKFTYITISVKEPPTSITWVNFSSYNIWAGPFPKHIVKKENIIFYEKTEGMR